MSNQNNDLNYTADTTQSDVRNSEKLLMSELAIDTPETLSMIEADRYIDKSNYGEDGTAKV
jgi:hypothetical protein